MDQQFTGKVERFYAIGLQALTDEQALDFVKQNTHGGEITMPCGAVAFASAVDQKCPNSGNCAAGIKECWVVKRFPAR